MNAKTDEFALEPTEPRAIVEVPVPEQSNDLAQMMRIAVEQGEAGVAVLERLVALQERAQDQRAARDFAQALADFQAACPAVSTNRAGAHDVRYADRAHIMRTIQPHLTQYGLSVAFDSDASDSERFTVFCIVRHIGGHSERTTFACPREQASKRMNVSQAEGSASEYAQRYALKLALNLTTGDNDDDAETAGAKPRLSDEQVASLSAIIDEIEGEREVNLEKFVKWAGVLVIEDIAAERYDECVRVAEAGRKSGK